VAIHQPEHMPWLGFLDKARTADLLVFLDHVQFRKRYFQNRNKIRTTDGWTWLTVPVQVKSRYEQAINEVGVDNSLHARWGRKYWETILHAYGKAPHFAEHHPFFEDVFARNWKLLVELNIVLIEYLLSVYGMSPKLIRSSDLPVKGHKGELILNICREVSADTYLSGISGEDYLPKDDFARDGIDVEIQEFHHPIYSQMHDPFAPCMSSVDLLFTHGPESRRILEGRNVPTIDEVYR
jgi:hypothetical protein